eukprot:6265591-Amphidinium_carterae.2
MHHMVPTAAFMTALDEPARVWVKYLRNSTCTDFQVLYAFAWMFGPELEGITPACIALPSFKLTASTKPGL